MGNNTNNS